MKKLRFSDRNREIRRIYIKVHRCGDGVDPKSELMEMIKKDHTNKKKRKKKEMQGAFSYFEKISTKPQIQKKKIQKITLTINFEIQTFHWLFVFSDLPSKCAVIGFS